jgi:lipopolysaccharide biosynthesis glycosyltransferase
MPPTGPSERDAAAAPFALRDSCLVFLLDRLYLKGLFVLMASLRRTAGLAAIPVVVLSDDRSVIEEPEIRRLAAHRMLIGGDFLARYKDLPRGAIPGHMQREHVPKYTWLKFAIFQDFGYRHNLYLDSDMAAFGDLEGFFSRLEGQDFDYAAAPNISRRIWEQVEDGAIFLRRLKAFEATLAPWSISRFGQRPISFNSGVSLIGRRLMGAAVIDRLFAQATRGGTQYEQRLTYFVLRELDAQFCELPLWANVTRPIHDLALRFGFEDVARQTLLHHYIFGKPWNIRREAAQLPSDRSWWAEEEAAAAEWPGVFRQEKP